MLLRKSKKKKAQRVLKVLTSTALVSLGAWILSRMVSGNLKELASPTDLPSGGAVDKIKDAVVRKAGHAFGDETLASEELVDQAIGAVKAGAGRATTALTDAAHS